MGQHQPTVAQPHQGVPAPQCHARQPANRPPCRTLDLVVAPPRPAAPTMWRVAQQDEHEDEDEDEDEAAIPTEISS